MPPPNIPQAFDLAVRRHHAGQLAEAETLYREILAAQPGHAGAHHFLGVVAYQSGRVTEAVERIRQSLALDPAQHAAHSNLGMALYDQGRIDEAAAAYRRAIELKPDLAEAHNNLGNALRDLGQLAAATDAFCRALELRPNFAKAHNNLGNALHDQCRFPEAEAAFRRAIALRPDYPEAHSNLAGALCEQSRISEAIAAAERAIQLLPDYPPAHNNLGRALHDQGQWQAAAEAYRAALRLNPQSSAIHSNLILALHFDPAPDTGAIFEAMDGWNRQIGDPLKAAFRPHLNDPNPTRRLRLGYVSPDFSDHVIGRNLVPLFSHQDRASFEIFCYPGVVRPDGFTDQFRGWSDHWRPILGLADDTVAETIRSDGIDILVDLTQHGTGHRLPLFARRPAPVQVSFAGCPESTGLEAIEYRISDRGLEPEMEDRSSGDSARPISDLRSPIPDRQVFLLDSFWCYDPSGLEVPVNELPAQSHGQITFGSLCNFTKTNDFILGLWARTLHQLPGSRLILLTGFGEHRKRTVELFEREGVEGSRLEFVIRCPRREYLELYHRLDIVLDPFPYGGHTTSLDALWMGVPVVSLAGQRAVSRAGLSILSNLGLPELVASSEDEYIEVATRLAKDSPRLSELRRTLRPRLENSVLMNAPHFARQIEAAFRAMWQRWCAGAASDSR
ncbi:MAG TPA: tetratricopeptide repeat protein [Chthoniobacter sp.]|jgi:predicted O-linked N-acetylglucosamine transferase (SPINDLY family)